MPMLRRPVEPTSVFGHRARFGSNRREQPSPGPGERSKVPQQSNVHGPMRQGDSLYVKWRLRTTGEIYEDTVDLRNRLPQDITNHRIYFTIKSSQLFVYLIPPQKRASGSNTPRMYPDTNARTIYPDPGKL